MTFLPCAADMTAYNGMVHVGRGPKAVSVKASFFCLRGEWKTYENFSSMPPPRRGSLGEKLSVGRQLT